MRVLSYPLKPVHRAVKSLSLIIRSRKAAHSALLSKTLTIQLVEWKNHLIVDGNSGDKDSFLLNDLAFVFARQMTGQPECVRVRHSTEVAKEEAVWAGNDLDTDSFSFLGSGQFHWRRGVRCGCRDGHSWPARSEEARIRPGRHEVDPDC